MSQTAPLRADIAAGWMVAKPAGLAWTPGMFRLLGLADDELAPSVDLFASFLHPADRAARSRLSALLQGAETTPFGARIRRRDGSVRRLSFVAAEPLRADDPQAICVTDLTETLGDLESERTQDYLSACLQEASDGILVIARSGNVLCGNARAFGLLDLEDARGSALWRRYPGLVHDPIWTFVQDGPDGPGHVRQERWVPIFDRWLSYSLTRIGDDTLFVFRDRDEIFRLRASLNESTANWAALLAAGGATILDASLGPPDGPVLVDEPGWSGVPAEIGPAGRDKLSEALRQAAVDRMPLDIELDLADAGSDLRLRLRGMVVSDDDVQRRRRFRGLAYRLGDGSGARQPADDASSALTGAQVRAARGALRWSVRELSEKSHVSVATINRFEADTPSGIARDSSVAPLKRALIAHGIVFFRRNGEPAIAVARQPAEVLPAEIRQLPSRSRVA